jgi:hypothetical protein
MGVLTQGKALWGALFTRTQRQLLSLFFGYPERSFYANEVVRKAGVGTGSVQRELARMTATGLLTVNSIGNQKHYQANPDSPIFPEIRGIVIKTYGIVDQVRRALLDWAGEIELALLYEQEADPSTSTIHLLLVSDDLVYADVIGHLRETGNRLGRGIRPLLLSKHEFEQLRRQEGSSVGALLRRPKVLLLGALEPADQE